jgi:dTDP-glucose 4,6-dehydratase
MAKKKKLMITGSGGFVFGNFIRQVFFSKLPYLISSIDRVRDSHIIHNIYVNADHSFYIADVRDAHTLHVIFEKERPDIVIHGAVESKDEGSMVNSNVGGTQNIINECLKIDARLIYISDNQIYGDLKSENENPYEESDPPNPRGTFAATKAAGELLVKASRFNGLSGLNYNIVRLSDNYGPWQMSTNLIPRIIDCILSDTNIDISGVGAHSKEWTHVFDTCSALFNVIDSGVDGEIYNITSKHEFSNLEVVQMICNTIGKGHELIKHVESSFSHRLPMTNDKIKALGWSPQLKFRDGIAQTCQWYLSNKYVLKM